MKAPLLVLTALAAFAAPASAQYVVLSGVKSGDPYYAAARLLASHHRGATIVRFDPVKPDAVLPRLRKFEPTHVAIVLRPEQIQVNTVRRILRMAAAVDDDPFVDFDFGYITGATPEEAVLFVRNIIRASTKPQPEVVGRGAVHGGAGRASMSSGVHEVGDRKLPLRNLVFRAPDGKHGRDQEFIDKHLAALEGCGAILMGGHGMPWEIGSGPRAEDVAKLSLFPAVAFNYACHTGVTRRYPQREYRAGNYVLRLLQIEAKKSFALSMIRAGVTGYTAYVNPRPAGPELHTDFQRVLAGASLGEARRNDYAKVALGYLGFGEPGIVPPDVVDGKVVPREKMDPVRHMMLDGATGGILYGDPSFRPFKPVRDALPIRIESEVKGGVLTVTATLEGQMAYLWGADPFRKFDAGTRTMAMKVYGKVELPKDLEVKGVRIESATWGGKPVKTLSPVWAVERDHGRRWLHLKANFARGGRGDVVVTFVAGKAAAPGPEPEETPGPGPSQVAVPDRAACLRHAKQVGEEILNSLAEVKTGDFYSGAAGVALFLLDLYDRTKEEKWLAGAEFLLDRAVERSEGPGLYSGMAGLGQTFLEAYRVTGRGEFLKRAEAVADALPEPTATDVISGAAGMGIFLLNLHSATGNAAHLDQARALGDGLAKRAVRDEDGARWPIADRNPRAYYGFSHGAAGIGYYLLMLAQATKTESYRKLADGAFRFVEKHAVRDEKGDPSWPKVHPVGNQVLKVQWCHGSPGISLFYRALLLDRETPARRKALEACMRAAVKDGRTARRNWSICHGVAGNAEALIDAYLHTRDESFLEAARTWAGDMIGPGGVKTAGYGPEYMTGLAGVGRFFLRLGWPEEVPPAMMVRKDLRRGK